MSVNIVKTVNGEKTLQKVAGLIPPAFASLGDCLEINADHELDVADNSITYEKIDNEIKNKITNVANSNDIYNESKSYVKGDIVIDTDYKLYELTANSYTGAIHPKDSDSWEETSLASYSNSLKSSLMNIRHPEHTYWSLLGATQISSGTQTISTYDGRKLSSFDLGDIVLCYYNPGDLGTYMRAMQPITMGRLQNETIEKFELIFTQGGSYHYVDIERVSDTSLKITTDMAGYIRIDVISHLGSLD